MKIQFIRRRLNASQLISLIEKSAPILGSGATLSAWMALKASERQEVHYAARNKIDWKNYLLHLDSERRIAQQKKSVKEEPKKSPPKIDSVQMAGGTTPVPLTPEQERFKKMMDLLERD